MAETPNPKTLSDSDITTRHRRAGPQSGAAPSDADHDATAPTDADAGPSGAAQAGDTDRGQAPSGKDADT